MKDSIEKRGYPLIEEILETNGYPTEERFMKGAVAVVECIQPIPCNPCEDACRFGAITIGEPIIQQPKLDYDKCKGCGLCIAKCPGLAIFMIDKTFSKTEALISFPYEYLPLPEIGQKVTAVDRSGTAQCKGTVIKVNNAEVNEGTSIVTLAIPKKYIDQVRGMERLKRGVQ